METILPTMDRHEFFRLVGTSVGAILITHCSAGCSKSDATEPASSGQAVDFTLNLDDAANANLNIKGGYVIANSVIVAQTKSGQFVAVTAKCTHQGTELVYKPTENQFYCPLHLSRFDTTGKVLNGPATVPLTQYAVDMLTASTIRVHS